MRQVISAFAIAGSVLFAASCTTSADHKRDAMIKEQAAQIEALKIEMVKKQVIDSMNAGATVKLENEKAVAAKKLVVNRAVTRSRSSKPRTVYTSNYSSPNAGAYSQPAIVRETAQPVAVQQQRKGWSAKAKGAVIGTAVGAGAGAVLNKRNRGAGAVIGAVLGAGAGTGIGAVIDKKNGR